MIGAITATPGWRTKVLWTLTAVFGFSCVVWIAAPAANPIMAAISPFAVALVESNALAMVGIVGVVALMIGGKSQSAATPPPIEAAPYDPLPAFADSTESKSKWQPDISFAEGADYLRNKTRWRASYGMSGESEKELIDALSAGKITAWGKAHPSDEAWFQIMRGFWFRATVTSATNYAFSNNRNVGASDIRLSKGELELVWPPKA